MNSLAYQMRSFSLEGVPPPSSNSTMCTESEFDASSFDTFMSTSGSASSFGSATSLQQQHQHTSPESMMNQGWGSGTTISRSQCTRNLSSLGSSASSNEGAMLSSQRYQYASGPNGFCGYSVDAPARWWPYISKKPPCTVKSKIRRQSSCTVSRRYVWPCTHHIIYHHKPIDLSGTHVKPHEYTS